MKYFKKIYKDRIACGCWNEGDAINYNEPENGKYKIEWCTKEEYDIIRQNIYNELLQKEKQQRIIELKKEIYTRQQINENYTEFENELNKLEAK